MAIQNDNTLVTKGDLKNLYSNKILPYLGGNFALATNVSDYYSTDEKIVGIWKDGKPLYQRSFDIGTESSTGMKNYTLNVANVDYAMLDFSHSFLYSKSGSTVTETLPLMIVWDTVSSGGFTLVPQTSSVKLQWYRKAWQNLPAIVTIQYTKTTDSAGSAATTPGCYDLNRPDLWPTNQEIFFGNGLYGYRAKGNFTATAPGSTFILNLVANAANFTIVNTGGSAKVTNSGGSTVMRMFGVNWSSSENKPTAVTLIDRGTNNYLRFQAMFVTDKATTSNTYDVWVTYTK